MKVSPYHDHRSKKKRDAKARYLMLLSQGTPAQEARDSIGRHQLTVAGWRKEDPEWAQRCDIAKQRARHGDRSKYKAPNMFIEFRRNYFGMETYWHHLQMVEAIETAPDDSITMILVAPEMGKTTLIEDLINYKLALEPNFRIGVISESQSHARKIVRRIQNRMTDDENFADYIRDYGPFKAEGRDQQKPWNADFFTCVRSNHDERDYSMAARGAGSKVYGSRYDLIILDDFQSRQTLTSTDKLVEFFRQDVLTRPGAKGRIIIIGTRVGQGDVYSVLMAEEGLIDKLVVIPALNRDGESICPDMWPTEKLKRRRSKVGEDIWAQVYMQQPSSPRTATFTYQMTEDVKDFKRNLGRGQVGDEVVCGLDPALGGNCAFMAASIDAERFYILDCETHKDLARYEEIYSLIERFSSIYRPSIWCIEENAFQKGLVSDSRLLDLADRYRFDIRPHRTNRNKLDPVIGVGSMASSFLARDGNPPELSIPWGPDARVRMADLIEELLNWRPNVAGRLLKQDLVMAMWFAWVYWQDARIRMKVQPEPLWRPSWMLPAS